MEFVFKIAETEDEYSQIYRLNYETFVEEIPQHKKNSTGTLIDKFNDNNVYMICLKGDEVIGMVSLNMNRPFSLDKKLDNLDSYLPRGKKPVEVRLLAVKKQYRGKRIFRKFFTLIRHYADRNGIGVAVMSGYVPRQNMYVAHGFIPFGPVTGSGDALYQPMYCTRWTIFKAAVKRKFWRTR